jgi:hypothetical protein
MGKAAKKKPSPPAADGSTRTKVEIPVVPPGMSVWSREQIAACQSIPTLEARVQAMEEHLVDLGLTCEMAEDQQRACQKRLTQLRAEARRVKVAKRRPPRKPR